MRRFGKKSVFWKWIISYISVMLILVVCNVVIYARNWEGMKERQTEMNQLVLQQLTDRVYDNALQMQKIREQILTNDNYLFLRRSSASQYRFQAYRRYALYTDLQEYQAVNDRCSKIMIYFEAGDYIVSSDTVNTSELYWQVFEKDLGELGLAWEEWTELLNGNYDTFHMKKIVSDGEEGVIYGRTLQSEQTGWQKVNIFFLYTASDLENMLVSHNREEALSVAIKGRNGEVILRDMGGFLVTEEDFAAVEEAVIQGLPRVEISNGDELRLDYEEGVLAGTVCLISSENVYMESMRKSQKLYVLTLTVTILFSMILIVLYAKRNYKPLQELLDVLEPEEWVSVKYKNEFALVQDKVSKVQKENKHVNMALRRQNKMFRGEYFAKLLAGNQVNLPQEQLEELYDISFISDVFAVMLFYVESYEEEREEGVDLDKAQFILNNIYHELLENESCRVYQTRVSDLLVLIVNLPEGGDGKMIFDEALSKGSEFINQYFNMGYAISISNLHEGRMELAAAYQEALQAMESKRLYGLDDMVYYSDIIEIASTGYYYPIETELELIRQIQASNFEGAKAIYESVVEKNMSGENIATQDVLRCLMYDLLGTIMKTLDEKKEDAKFAKELKPAKKMMNCQSISQLRETFEEILQKTCDYLSEKSGSEDNETLCSQIQDYIRKNFYDPNLSVTSIAEHFSLPPVMMSKMFRETVGEKIPNVVSEVRLEAAKKLMCQSDESLGEIAEKAGFGSVRTFTRIFKQVENCTPGQWRETHS